MIPHHRQPLEIAALVADRTVQKELIDVAGRINASHGDEIEFMQQWLLDLRQHVPDPALHAAMHSSHRMAGMATAEQMPELAVSDGSACDRLFLELIGCMGECWDTLAGASLRMSGSGRLDPTRVAHARAPLR